MATSRVNEIAEALTDLSLEARPGAHLGAEEELLDRLRVSRPTLRLAAKLVESARLLEVRRGVRGGFYAARPDATDAIRGPTHYLRMNGATIMDIHAVTSPISEQVAGLAAASKDPLAREALATFRDRIDSAVTISALIRAEVEFARLLARTSGNPAAELFIEISYTFGLEEQRMNLYDRAEDRDMVRKLQRAIVEAVLAGDAEVARLMMRRRSEFVTDLLARHERLHGRPGGPRPRFGD